MSNLFAIHRSIKDNTLAYIHEDKIKPISSLEEFINNVCDKTSVVKLCGSNSNSQLILDLAKYYKEGRIASVLITGPVYDNIEIILKTIYSDNTAASLGGPHVLTDLDIASYRCAVSSDEDTFEHPLIKRLRWIPDLSVENCCKLIGLIRDPRWYIDTARPDRISRLVSYLGLWPGVVRDILQEKSLDSVRLNRCKLVISCWSNKEIRDLAQHNLQNMVALDSANPETFIGQRPGDFLLRRYVSKLSKPATNKQIVLSLLRTSKHFIRFLRYLWLDLIYGQQQPEWKFDAARFFKLKIEEISFNSYLNTL